MRLLQKGDLEIGLVSDATSTTSRVATSVKIVAPLAQGEPPEVDMEAAMVVATAVEAATVVVVATAAVAATAEVAAVATAAAALVAIEVPV